MNHISKTHEEFYRRLNNPRVLTHPQEFLGPNYKAVLNFWLLLEKHENNYDAMNKLNTIFRSYELEHYWKIRESAMNSSSSSCIIKVIILNLLYGNFSFYRTIREFIALASLELMGNQSTPLVIHYFLNELTHS